MISVYRGATAEKKLTALSQRSSGNYPPAIEKKVRRILERVRRRGDEALFDYTDQFDHVKLTRRSVRVSPHALTQAVKAVPPQFKAAFREAQRRIFAYHRAQQPKQLAYFLKFHGVGLRVLPLETVGVYVPGGQVPLFSSVLMNVVPAQVAGVARIVMVTPAPQGKVSPYLLFAAAALGVHEVYQVGGAQAIAALAYGTASIPKVDKIVGPGNLFVTLAKRLVFGEVGIDKLAGPSDVVILADETANPEWVAADLLAQAEHDPLALSILITPSARLAKQVAEAVQSQGEGLSRVAVIKQALKNGGIFLVKNIEAGIQWVNRLAPEHLGLMVRSLQQVLAQVKHAGAVFLGGYSPQALGDYLAGPNHVLPTEGTARFSSPLTVFDFVKFQSVVAFDRSQLAKVRYDVETLAAAESLMAHAQAITARFS